MGLISLHNYVEIWGIELKQNGEVFFNSMTITSNFGSITNFINY
jgi:hypothetical protein